MKNFRCHGCSNMATEIWTANAGAEYPSCDTCAKANASVAGLYKITYVRPLNLRELIFEKGE